ncbi:hypothetical protein A3860_33495 [Niastella vici]|uniref:Letm1 RBD domain-containing protein n=1 Tax=Niastella vici TaxID=1703345 RepID=A0A1V9FQ34_9BACT|nr:hypothetical protein [Niastella vici]OQP60440.1 hypothetical protein A3860_33495 [Niastella vici]
MEIIAILETHIHHFLHNLKTEGKGEREAALIIVKFIREGKITAEEDHILKTQVMDSLKILGIGVPFVLIPGASVLMPILIKVASKHHIELMPSAFITQAETNLPDVNLQHPDHHQGQ